MKINVGLIEYQGFNLYILAVLCKANISSYKYTVHKILVKLQTIKPYSNVQDTTGLQKSAATDMTYMLMMEEFCNFTFHSTN